MLQYWGYDTISKFSLVVGENIKNASEEIFLQNYLMASTAGGRKSHVIN